MYLTCANAQSIQDELSFLHANLWNVIQSTDPESVDQFASLTRLINIRENFLAKSGDRYIILNKRDYTLRVIDNGKEVFLFKAIIGRKEQPTPLIESFISSIVVNPDWIVTPRTAVLKIAPRFAKNPDYADVMGYQIYAGWGNESKKLNPKKINWQQLIDKGNVPYKIRQVPGHYNELGTIKFIVPNTDGIFIHGTPNKSLFETEVREYSSGCIRISEVVELADFLMEDRLSSTEINTLIKNKQTRSFIIPRKMPVYVVDWEPVMDNKDKR